MKSKSDHLKNINTCMACGLQFRAVRSDCLFCDARCYSRNRRNGVHKNPRLGAREIPLTPLAIEVREIVLRGASYHAEYYSATSVDLQIAFPLPNDTVRSTGLKPTMPFYKLEPFEFPMVPIEGVYRVHYFSAMGLSVSAQDRKPPPEILMTFTYPLRKRAPADVRGGVRQFLTDRKPRLALPTPKNKRLGLAGPSEETGPSDEDQ